MYVYSRLSSPNSTRLEVILTKLLQGPSITYSSGLAAFFAMITYLKPKTIAISDGYHGCHGALDILATLYPIKKIPLPTTKAEWEAAELGPGDVVHIETPLNPTGEAKDLATLCGFAAKKGASVTVDATFGPPPLQNPFDYGVRIVMHSGTKYFGGHSDMLCGVLACMDKKDSVELWKQRMYLGSVMGNLEGWLGVRSMRTLELRVLNQSRNATNLALWLHNCLTDEKLAASEEAKIIKQSVVRVSHASIQALDPETNEWLSKQMPGGYGPVFALNMKETELARRLPSKLDFFHHATSLGGVESLIEWRKLSDPGADPTLLRISVGLESWEDLKLDLLRGLKELVTEGVANGATKEAGALPVR
jgi:cystathionine gamma-synthase